MLYRADNALQAPNVDKIIEEGKKKPKANIDFKLHGLWGEDTHTQLDPEVFTPSGWPAVSTPVLRSLAGRPGAAKKALGVEDADGEGTSHDQRFAPYQETDGDMKIKDKACAIAVQSLSSFKLLKLLLNLSTFRENGTQIHICVQYLLHPPHSAARNAR